ncbi:uncharacterized protein LOC135472118 [Liolophura sinensis]|uniref:uncharacterized protein LOC135472118 n=1 Tax=Liolophura sinensis TaxID=3198878 RepID=UPI0031596C3B
MHGAHSLTFLGRYNPEHGALERSSFFLARLSSGSGNSVSTQSIAAGKDGVVVAAQTSVASIEHRDSLSVNGHKVADYGGNDAVLLGLPSGFDRRLVWNVFTKTSGKAGSDEVAVNTVNGKTVAVLLAHAESAEFYTFNAISGTHHVSGHSGNQYAIIVAPINS